MNKFSIGNTSQGSISQSSTKEGAKRRIGKEEKQLLYSQRNYYKKNDKNCQQYQSQQSCQYTQQNYESQNNLIEQEQYVECDWRMHFNEEGCNAEQIQEFAEGVSKIRTPYPSKKIKIKFQPNRQNIEKQQNKLKYVMKMNSDKCIQQNSCSEKTGRKQIKLRSSRKKNQNEMIGFNSIQIQQNNINQQYFIQPKAETQRQIKKINGNPQKSKTNLNYTQALNFCIASTINPNSQNQSNTKSIRGVDVQHSFMIDQQNVIKQNNDKTQNLKKDRMSTAKAKSIENPKKSIKIINNFIEDELSQSETQQQNKPIKINQRNELKILKVQKIRSEKEVQDNECQDQTQRERQRRRKGSDEHRNENKFDKQEEQSQKQVEIKCFKKKKQIDSQISTNYQSKDRQEVTSIANNQKRKPEPDFHEQLRSKSQVRVPLDQSQNPQQNFLSPSHTSQPFIEQSYINKVISEMMMQNNEYLHRVNESVVNRLLSIIENQSQNGQSMMSSMKNSRWNDEQFIKNGSSRQQSFNNQSNMKGKVARIQHNKSKSHDIQTSPKLQKNPQYYPTTHTQQNGPLQILANMQSKPSSIMVSLVNQNSQTQQMATQPSGSLNQTLKQQQLDLMKLESKRNRRSREFVQQREKQKYGTISDAQRINDFTQTPRPSQSVCTTGNKNSDPNLTKNVPTISPIHNIQYQQSSQQITPCVSHNVSLANDNTNQNILKKSSQNKQKINGNSNNIKQNEKRIEIEHKKPVFMEIPKDEQSSIGGGISLAEAFKRKIGKLPSRQERKAKQLQNQQNDMPNNENNKQLRPKQFNHETAIKNTIMTSSAKPLRQTLKKRNTSLNHCKQQGNASNLQIDTQSLKGSKGVQNMFVTPKSCEPSEQLLNRLIGGSKAKISKKEMYALTRKNYQNLPEVRQKKRQEQKKQKQIQRLERIKQYQKSIRASKITITSNNNN